MIRGHEKNAAILFREWASNFSEGLFVMLKVYADETGTHEGADVVALAGLIESREYWQKFNRKWQAVLDNYDAKFFHYREFRKDANTRPDDPYFGWSDEKRRNFIFRLAMLTGESAVPTGGAFSAKRNDRLEIKENRFETAIRSFYKSVIAILNLHWPQHTKKVLFIFDCCKNKEWNGLLIAIHAEYQYKDQRIGSIAFASDKDPAHLALQAADLSAIHFRNSAREYIETDGEHIDTGVIDFIVHKNQDVAFRRLPKDKINKLLTDIREHETRQTALWRQHKIKRTYLPLVDFPFKEYGYKK